MTLGKKIKRGKNTKVLKRKVPILGKTELNSWAAVAGFRKEKVKRSCSDTHFSVK